MPKATRSSQNQRTYRATPLVPQNLTSQEDRYRLRQLQARTIAHQQVQQQQARAAQQQIQQQQQQLIYPSLDDMQSYTHNNGGSHLSYGSHSMAPLPSLYMPQTMPHQQLPQPMLPLPVTNSAPPLPAHVLPNRPSSGAWSPQDDQQLMTARAAGHNWSQIQSNHFPSKTPNACRKRHERLMDRKNGEDWDALKLETLGTEYMAMRKEIWGPLAEKVGEKWAVVEAKVFSQGIKGMQSATRMSQRRAKHAAGGLARSSDGTMEAHGSSYTDDSALGEDIDEYSGSPDTDYDHYDTQTGEYMSHQHSRKHSQQMQYQPSQSSQMMPSMNSQYLDRNGYVSGEMGLPQMMRHGSHSHTNSMGSNMSNGGRDMGIHNIINRGV